MNDEEFDEQERMIVSHIKSLQAQYHEATKPYYKLLTQLHSLRPAHL